MVPCWKRGTSEHLEATRRSLVEAIGELTSTGASLVFIEVLPPGKSVDCLQNGGPFDEACVRPVTPESGEAPYNAMLRDLASEPGDKVYVVSVTDIVCPDRECPLMWGDTVLRYDGGHFTATASALLAPILDERLADAGIDLSALGNGS